MTDENLYEGIERIVVDTGKPEKKGHYRVVGDLKRCMLCKTSFTAVQPCLICELRLSLMKKLGRRPTKEEWMEELRRVGMED